MKFLFWCGIQSKFGKLLAIMPQLKTSCRRLRKLRIIIRSAIFIARPRVSRVCSQRNFWSQKVASHRPSRLRAGPVPGAIWRFAGRPRRE